MYSLLKRLVATFFTLAVLWGCGFVWFVAQIPTSTARDTARTDAIVVLTGGSLRLEHGLSLLVSERADRLFISGVEEGVSLPSLLRGKEVSNLVGRVPLDKVELGHFARSTLQNAEETRDWVEKHHLRSIRLVTGNYHMPRSHYVMHQAMPEVAIIEDPVFPAEFYNNSWWLSDNTIRLVVSEYHKYMASVLASMLGITSEE